MPVLEDYTAASVNLQAAVENNFQPVRRTYEWRYGLEDGAPPGARARFPARIPKPPKEMPDQGPRGKEEGRTRGDIRHGARWEERRAGRGGAGSCNDKAFDWPRRHDDDDSDDYEHPGRSVDGYAKYRGRHEPRRVRSRSPRRRDTSFHGGRHHGADEPVRRERTRSPRRRGVEFSTAPLQNETTPQTKKIFTEQVLPPQCDNQRDLYDKEQQLQWMRKAEEYLLRTGSFTNRLGVNTDTMGRTRGNGAWSATIPARHVFGRLREEMPAGFGLGRPAATAPRHLNFEAQDEATGADHNDGDAQPMDVDDLHGDGVGDQHGGGTAASLQAAQQPQVADLFTVPEPPLLSQPPLRRQRARRTFDMTAVLQQYVDGIGGPLPDSLIAALTAFLDLDDEETERMTEALIEQAGEGLQDLQQIEGAAVPAAA
ncbi:unnamed protein product [Urochloa humidicola]